MTPDESVTLADAIVAMSRLVDRVDLRRPSGPEGEFVGRACEVLREAIWRAEVLEMVGMVRRARRWAERLSDERRTAEVDELLQELAG